MLSQKAQLEEHVEHLSTANEALQGASLRQSKRSLEMLERLQTLDTLAQLIVDIKQELAGRVSAPVEESASVGYSNACITSSAHVYAH